MAKIARSYKELEVYENAIKGTMFIFEISKKFPDDERYSLTSQIRRSSRSVCSNLAEGWRKRRYRAAFVAKLSDAESEACETQVWADISLRCEYIDEETYLELDKRYNHIIGQLVRMIQDADRWLIK